MTDAKLLELAAKAHSGLVYITNCDWIHEDENGNRGAWWNPLIDDADAFRLMMNFNISTGDIADAIYNARKELNSGFDLLEDTRRAIVLCAAEIGKGMK